MRSGFAFHQDFQSSPAVFAQVQSLNEEDTVEARLDSITKAGFTVRLMEETTKDSEVEHAAELVGYMAFNLGPIVNKDGKQIGSPKLAHWRVQSTGYSHFGSHLLHNSRGYFPTCSRFRP